MAGAFGGDDEELPDVEETEDENNEEYKEDETADEEEMNAIQRKIFELEENRLKEKLPKILQKVQSKQLPILGPLDKNTYNKAKKHENLKSQVKAIDMALNVKRVQFASKVMSAIAPAIPYILIGALIIIAIIAFVAIIGSLMPWLFPDDNLGDAGGSQFGVKGDKFYGVRTVYSDDELAKAGLLEHYSSILENVRTAVNEYTFTITRQEDSDGDGSEESVTYNVEVNVNLPELIVEENSKFDYSLFLAEDFQTKNADLADYQSLLKEISSTVYAIDNSTTAPTDLNEILKGINYFGLNASHINTTETDSSKEDVDDIISVYFSDVSNYDISIKKVGEAEDATGVALTTEEQDSLKLDIETKVTESLNNVTLIRTEKLFIKDYIFETEEDGLKNLSKQNYITAIFMPKQNVTFTKFSFYVSYVDENTTVNIVNGSSLKTLSKDDASFSTGEDAPSTYSYYLDNTSVSAGAYANINTAKVDALSGGVSLIEIVTNTELINETYLKMAEGQTDIYTYKDDGVRIDFVKPDAEDVEPFIFTEFETIYE